MEVRHEKKGIEKEERLTFRIQHSLHGAGAIGDTAENVKLKPIARNKSDVFGRLLALCHLC